jgi:hypothetical protein
MRDETVVTLDSEQAKSLWQGAKVELEFLLKFIDGIALVARDMIESDPVDHPTRVYVHKPSDRFLAVMTPVLGLEPVQYTHETVRWKVALSDETDKADPVWARAVNCYIAEELQTYFWKKDAEFVVDSAPPKAPESNLVAIDFASKRST